MRLTKLKLAGFKSFVDPTTLLFPGQLVGVVGPNGCGKSNIMDAVRWVLGESKASELRGESMQDVIFNGSTQRAPVSRAQVELVFDNSQGRALGQWSEYAELSVKRVLTRAGQSDYLINNLKVRRKDVTDLFLGTGLGPRAYAIIGQGMISRIIEARPEELRVFLEEAAGVTRYKERRRETESRMEDTRENLVRIEDIRRELSGQIEHLGGQAEQTRRYHEYQKALQHKQQVLCLLRHHEALDAEQAAARAVQAAETDLEVQMAELRATESRLEKARESHFIAGDRLHQCQSDVYTRNAEVARLEAEIRHHHHARSQIQERLGQLNQESAHWKARADKSAADHAHWEDLQAMAASRQKEASDQFEQQAAGFPEAEAALSSAQQMLSKTRQSLNTLEQQYQIELTHKNHNERTRQALQARQTQCAQERAGWVIPDPAEIEKGREQFSSLQAVLQDQESRLMAYQADLASATEAQQTTQETFQAARQALAQVEAQVLMLEQLQAQTPQVAGLSTWLEAQGIASELSLWREIEVESGWETAVEAVLRERLNALPTLKNSLPLQRPPATTVLQYMGTDSKDSPLSLEENNVPADHLMRRIRCHPDIRPLLQGWMGDVRCADTLSLAVALSRQASLGTEWVTPEGDRCGLGFVHYFVPDPGTHGFLARQRELEALAQVRARLQDEKERAEAMMRTAQLKRSEAESLLTNARQAQGQAQSACHQAQLQLMKLEQAQARHQERLVAWEAQSAAISKEMAEEKQQEQTLLVVLEGLSSQLAAVRTEATRRLDALRVAEQAVRQARETSGRLERELREAEFACRECAGKLSEIEANQTEAKHHLSRVGDDQAAVEARLAALPADNLDAGLQLALDQKVEAEKVLAERRGELERDTQALRALEEQRLKTEHTLDPLRARIQTFKLEEQAAHLNAVQWWEQLGLSEANLDDLRAELPDARASTLNSEITRLQKALNDLGAVNLAALQELEAAETRKAYLDSQAADLTEALETLENAIRRIDRETRDLLRSTFDAVNQHVGQLFPELFGGGRAALLMTGEEILDAGVQVMAQPPGKKNSSIHLLSGGEKALTAIALVFAMFQLNPAPFCLLDEVDAPLDDSNTERFCTMVKKMSMQTQFLFISHNKIAMEMAGQLIGVTMQESGVSRVVDVDIEEALRISETV